MKQYISLFLAFVLCMFFTSCDKQSNEAPLNIETPDEIVSQDQSESSATCPEDLPEDIKEPEPVAYDPILDFYDDVLKIAPPQYSASEIQEMIDNDLSLDEVAEKISTPADLVQFLYRRGFRTGSGSVTFDYGGYNWSVNKTARTVFEQNAGNCGGGSNLANYILKGDTEEQGYVELSANEWGHVFNYFKIDGVYHYIDLTTITRNEYNNEWHMLFPANSPQEWAEGYIERNRENEPADSPNYFLFVFRVCCSTIRHISDGREAPYKTNRIICFHCISKGFLDEDLSVAFDSQDAGAEVGRGDNLEFICDSWRSTDDDKYHALSSCRAENGLDDFCFHSTSP